MGSTFSGSAPSMPQSTDPLQIATRGKNKGTSLATRSASSLFGNYYPSVFPQVLGLQEQYAPKFIEQAFGFGGQALTGFQGLQRAAGTEAAQSMADLRAKELGAMTGQAGMTRGLMETLSPEQAAAVSQAAQTAQQAQGLESDFMGRAGGMMGQYGSQVGQYDPTISGANADVTRATQMAQEAFARRGALSPEEQRSAQQQAREAFSASGRLGGNAAIAAEIQNREAARAARRSEASTLGQQAFGQQLGAAGQQLAAEQALFSQGIAAGAQRAQERQLGFGQLMDIEQRRAAAREEAAQAGQRSYGMAGGFYTQPGLGILESTPASYTAGTSLAGMGLNLGQTLGPEIDYNLPLNLARERAGAIDARNLAQFQADMQARAARNEMIGSIIQGGASAFMMSDRRLKTDIKRVGTTDSGLPVYTYKYKGDNTTQMGVMAQDVEKVNPEAVAEFGGFKAVNYSLIK